MQADSQAPGAASSNRQGFGYLTECFDGDEHRAMTFLQNTWLPDAFATMASLTKSAKNADSRQVACLSGLLEMGATAAGCRPIASCAKKMTVAAEIENWAEVTRICNVVLWALEAIAGWLHEKTQ